MSDILKEIGGYPEDASVIMSKRVVADVVDEIARLRVERDALRAAINKAVDDLAEIELEQEIYVGGIRIQLAAALNNGGGDE